MSSLSQLMGGGATVKQGSTFEEMDVIGSARAPTAQNSCTNTLLFLKPTPTSTARRNDSGFWSSFNMAVNTGASAIYGASGQWTTVVNTTGTSGKLVNVFPALGTAACNIEIEVTIDGVMHVYAMRQYSGGTGCFLGSAVIVASLGGYGGTAVTLSDIQSLPSSTRDPGFSYPGAVNYYIPSPMAAVQQGFKYLQWLNSMKVRVRIVDSWVPAGTAALGSANLNYAMASFVIR